MRRGRFALERVVVRVVEGRGRRGKIRTESKNFEVTSEVSL